MSAKNEIVSTIMQEMALSLDMVQTQKLSQVLSHVLEKYIIEPKNSLPTVNVSKNRMYMQRFLASKKIEGCLDSSLRMYKYNVCRFAEAMGVDLDAVDSNSIRYYLGMFSSMNKQNSYINSVRLALNTFFQWMEDEDYVVKNPCKKVKKIKVEKKMEIPFSDTEIVLLQDACKTKKETCLIDILLSTGIRREEATKIKISDINFDECKMKIHGKGAKERIVYFSARCRLHMLAYLKTRKYNSQYIFASRCYPHDHLSVDSLHKYIKKIGIRAGVANVHLHRFRKWFGTSMADKGVDIRDLKEMMGHEKIETTNSYYIYANMTRIQSEHRRYAV